MADVVCVVPARMASTRFPGKPLVDVGGLPMVVRSARRAIAAGCFGQVVVATEDQVVVDCCREHDLECLLTPVFPTGTDRVAWAVRELGAAYAVNLQGDEPVFPLDLLRDLAHLVTTDPDALWTAADLMLTENDILDPDVVKIVLDPASTPRVETPRRGVSTRGIAGMDVMAAMDFHRDLTTAAPSGLVAIHVGVYGGSAQTLSRFAKWAESPLETVRRIEPLRALAHGMRVSARIGKWNRAAVDRREHISSVLPLLEGEP